MNRLSLALVFLIFSSFGLSAQTNLVKTLDPDGAETIKFEFKHKAIELDHWTETDKENLRLRMEIHSNMPAAIMAQLVKANRYVIKGQTEGNSFVLTAPNLEKSVTVGGTDLDDHVVVYVTAPIEYFLDGKTLNKGVPLVARDGRTIVRIDTSRKDKIKSTFDPEIELVFVQTNAAIAGGGTLKDKVGAATLSGADLSKRNLRGESTAAPMSIQEMKAQYGEILIDGVVFEIE